MTFVKIDTLILARKWPFVNGFDTIVFGVRFDTIKKTETRSGITPGRAFPCVEGCFEGEGTSIYLMLSFAKCHIPQLRLSPFPSDQQAPTDELPMAPFPLRQFERGSQSVVCLAQPILSAFA